MNLLLLSLLGILLCQASGLRKGPVCGVAKGGGNMVTGGTEADPNEYPWTVSRSTDRIQKLICVCLGAHYHLVPKKFQQTVTNVRRVID